MHKLNDKVNMWIDPSEIEPQALSQIYNVAAIQVVDGLAVMPDCHYGNGATVGSVIASRTAVIPAAVGVDIGCGMCAVKTNLTASDLPDDLGTIRHSLERTIPVGFNQHKDSLAMLKNIDTITKSHVEVLLNAFKDTTIASCGQFDSLKIHNQLGTLGGGNHFIELCLDETQTVWVMLHSGSRNIGKVIAEYHITKAKEYVASKGLKYEDELAWLSSDGDELGRYILDVTWAQHYSSLNRAVMLDKIMANLKYYFPTIEGVQATINCHHNYISLETYNGNQYYITRKGAIKAGLGDIGIIPGSMGTKSYIVSGKGVPESYNSCSHGAGRRMSRGEAKRKYTIKDVENQTLGVECRKDAGIIDEIPSAYKKIDDVMNNQKDLVEIQATLKAVLCIKG